MTAILMASAGTIAAAAGGVALDTTITSMGNQIYFADSSEDWRYYGYDGGVDFGSASNMGSIGDDTYTDGGSNSRTISALYYAEDGSGEPEEDNLLLSMNATSIPNTDTTFVSLEYGGETYTRSTATYHATQGSASSWYWSNVAPNPPQSGNPVVIINI